MLQSTRRSPLSGLAALAMAAAGIAGLGSATATALALATPLNMGFASRNRRSRIRGEAQPAGHKHVNVARVHADGGFGRGLANAITRRQLAALQKAGKHVEGSYIGKGPTRRLWGTPLPTWLPTTKA